MRPCRTSLFARVTALLAALLLVTSPLSAFAAPTTAQIEAKRTEAAAAQAKLDEMRDDFEEQVEEYNRIDAALQETREHIADARARLAVEDSHLVEAQRVLQDRADGIYRRGIVDIFEVVLNTTSFEDFITRVEMLQRIATSDAQIVTNVRDARQRVVETKRVLEQRLAEQVSLRAKADAKRGQVEAAMARQQTFLESLNGEIAQLIKAEEERLAREAAERAARIAAEQAAAAARAAAEAKNGPARSKPVKGERESGELGAGHPEVVGIAMKYLGVPYVWGGTTPNGFDCSGLVQYSYRQIGIRIPRTSQEQYYAGTHIPADRLDQLKPGDLLFFGRKKDPNRVHHVVMFVGGDDIVEAPYTGARVRVASLSARLSRGEYVGASRF